MLALCYTCLQGCYWHSCIMSRSVSVVREFLCLFCSDDYCFVFLCVCVCVCVLREVMFVVVIIFNLLSERN